MLRVWIVWENLGFKISYFVSAFDINRSPIVSNLFRCHFHEACKTFAEITNFNGVSSVDLEVIRSKWCFIFITNLTLIVSELNCLWIIPMLIRKTLQELTQIIWHFNIVPFDCTIRKLHKYFSFCLDNNMLFVGILIFFSFLITWLVKTASCYWTHVVFINLKFLF